MTVRLPRAVIDTNTFVSAAIRFRSPPALAVGRAFSEGVVLYSDETGDELKDVLLRPKFERYQIYDLRKEYLDSLFETMKLIEIVATFNICRHPKDDKFLDLAVSGNANVIITGDKDLLVLHPFRGISILTPMVYLAL